MLRLSEAIKNEVMWINIFYFGYVHFKIFTSHSGIPNILRGLLLSKFSKNRFFLRKNVP